MENVSSSHFLILLSIESSCHLRLARYRTPFEQKKTNNNNSPGNDHHSSSSKRENLEISIHMHTHTQFITLQNSFLVSFCFVLQIDYSPLSIDECQRHIDLKATLNRNVFVRILIMTSEINFNQTLTTIIGDGNESTAAATTASIHESSLDELCKNFHVSLFR